MSFDHSFFDPTGNCLQDQFGADGGGKSPTIQSEYRWEEGKSYPAVNRVNLQEVSRAKVSKLILAAFPATTKRESARRCATFTGFSRDSIEGYIKQQHAAPFELIFAIGTLRGAWFVLEVMTEGQSRLSFLNKIARGVRRVAGR